MSMTKYELKMLEQKRLEQEIRKEKKRVGMIVAVIMLAVILGFVGWLVTVKMGGAMNEIENQMTTPIPQSKG